MNDSNAILQKGDTVAIVNIAAPEPADFPDRLSIGIQKIESLGLRVKPAPHLTKKSGIFSAAPSEVAGEINDLWEDDEVRALICAGGGIAGNAEK